MLGPQPHKAGTSLTRTLEALEPNAAKVSPGKKKEGEPEEERRSWKPIPRQEGREKAWRKVNVKRIQRDVPRGSLVLHGESLLLMMKMVP